MAQPVERHGHHVRVIAKDRERVRGQSAGRDVHGGRGQFAGNLVHVGNHQQQALRGGESGSECTGLQCAVECARGAAFTLQFFDDGQRAPDIFLAFRAPLIGPLGHGRRGGNGVDGDDFRETIGNGGCGLVTIENHHFVFTHSLCLIARPAEKNRYEECLFEVLSRCDAKHRAVTCYRIVESRTILCIVISIMPTGTSLFGSNLR